MPNDIRLSFFLPRNEVGLLDSFDIGISEASHQKTVQCGLQCTLPVITRLLAGYRAKYTHLGGPLCKTTT